MTLKRIEVPAMNNSNNLLKQSVHELHVLELQIKLLNDQINHLKTAPRKNADVLVLMNSLVINIHHVQGLVNDYQTNYFIPILGSSK